LVQTMGEKLLFIIDEGQFFTHRLHQQPTCDYIIIIFYNDQQK